MYWKKVNQCGLLNTVPLLVMVSVIGLISFLVISSSASFNQGLLAKLFSRRSSQAAATYNCTQIIGFSQTYQWFYGGTPNFKDVVGPNWQLLWQGGAGIDSWADPNYVGWSASAEQLCPQLSSTPDRVLLNVTGPYRSDLTLWKSDITGTINNTEAKYPSV